MQSPLAWAVCLMLFCLPLGAALADELPITNSSEPQIEETDEDRDRDRDRDDDDTADVDTQTTVDNILARLGLISAGDIRPIFNYFDLESRDGATLSDDALGFRLRLVAGWGITESLRVGARLAGNCYTDSCDLDVVLDNAPSAAEELEGGQLTLDELYLHWFRTERGSIAVGRLQTRFVLRGGVFAKSLDRNNSNNVNINWTDGVQATYRAGNGWNSTFILERNDSGGSGSIRHLPLNFDDSTAKTTYFAGFENIRRWGPIVQRGFDISYLPASLLKDGDPSGRREDYWGLVGRLAARWPQRSEGIRLRLGTEIGYAPETPTREAANLDTSVSGLAWNVVATIVDFRPRHSFGVNYARTGAGWLLSPQYRPNEELFELRYQWRPRNFPLLEARVRWREDLEQPIGTLQKLEEFDMYIRLTWEFTLKGR